MPIREYRCKNCQKQFERIEIGPQEGKVKCPDCGSDNVAKLLSLFSRSKPTGSSCDITRHFG